MVNTCANQIQRSMQTFSLHMKVNGGRKAVHYISVGIFCSLLHGNLLQTDIQIVTSQSLKGKFLILLPL